MLKVAILVDWENIKYRILKPLFFDKIKNLEWLKKFPDYLKNFLENGEFLYRIFIYLCEPYEKTIRDDNNNIIYSPDKSFSYNFTKRLITSLSVKELVAIRKGRYAFRSFKRENDQIKPDFEQKQVDMLIGLDIAHLTYFKLVDRILFFCYDTDLVPALKIARKGGIQVILPYFKELSWYDIPLELKEHTDFIRMISTKNFEMLKKQSDGL